MMRPAPVRARQRALRLLELETRTEGPEQAAQRHDDRRSVFAPLPPAPSALQSAKRTLGAVFEALGREPALAPSGEPNADGVRAVRAGYTRFTGDQVLQRLDGLAVVAKGLEAIQDPALRATTERAVGFAQMYRGGSRATTELLSSVLTELAGTPEGSRLLEASQLPTAQDVRTTLESARVGAASNLEQRLDLAVRLLDTYAGHYGVLSAALSEARDHHRNPTHGREERIEAVSAEVAAIHADADVSAAMARCAEDGITIPVGAFHEPDSSVVVFLSAEGLRVNFGYETHTDENLPFGAYESFETGLRLADVKAALRAHTE